MAARTRSRWLQTSILAASAVIALAAGCSSPPDPPTRYTQALQACVDLLKSVTDPAAASAAAGKLKPAFGEVAAAQDGLMSMAQTPKAVLANLDEIQRMQFDVDRLSDALDAETARLQTLKGLPVEFWNVFRVESNRFVLKTVEAAAGVDPDLAAMLGPMQQCVAMYDQYGPEKTLEFQFQGADEGDANAAVERLRTLAGGSAQVASMPDPDDSDVMLATVAPVEDFDKLIAAIDFGTVVDQEKARGEAIIALNPMEGTASDAAEVTPTDSSEVALAGATDGDGRSTDGDGRGGDGRGGDGRGGEGYSEIAVDGDGRPLFDEFGQPIDGQAAADEEWTVQGTLAGAAATFRAGVGLLKVAEASGVRELAGPSPRDPQYHAKLAELLFDAQAMHHQTAVLTLLEIRPQDVPDKAVRAQVARGYKEIAFAAGANVNEGVRGLVIWGGKFSVPLLFELLGQQQAGAEQAIYDGLAVLATAEAAEGIVTRLSDAAAGMSNSEAAFACLRKMGPVAEAALLAALPFESPESNRAAIEVLREIGTKKSLTILRRASRSENTEVGDAALEAIREIQVRDRKARAGS